MARPNCVAGQLENSGTALPRDVREHLQTLFGVGLDDVRVYVTDTPDALAWTEGSEIHVHRDVYDPYDPAGLEILGHEVAHVLQHRHGRVRASATVDGVPVNTDPALEAEAVLAGRRIAMHRPVRIAGSAVRRRGLPIRQYYTVVAPGGFAVPVPVHNPAPAANVGNSTFVHQFKGGGGAVSNSSFVAAASHAPQLDSTAPAAVTLRVSAGNRMAVQDSDLTTRQPKVFFATQAVVNESNARLLLFGSSFQLVPDPAGVQRITVGGHTLLRVTPEYVPTHSTGVTMAPGFQGCDGFVEKVAGSERMQFTYEDPAFVPTPFVSLPEYHLARDLLNVPLPPVLNHACGHTLAESARAITVAYAAEVMAPSVQFTAKIKGIGVNQHAAPSVGEGFVISTLEAVAPYGALVPPGHAIPRASTHEDRTHLVGAMPQVVRTDLTWGSHWGGVVAQDGTDVITLENYARSLEDGEATTARTYFQMYDTTGAGGRSWHDNWRNVAMAAVGSPAWAPPAAPIVAPYQAATHSAVSPGTKAFTNAITIRVTLPDDRFDAIALEQFPARNLDPIKDAHNQVNGAADAHQQALHVLKGLRYANVRLEADDPGRGTRLDAWWNALGAAAGANTFPGNRRLIRYTRSRIGAIRRG